MPVNSTVKCCATLSAYHFPRQREFGRRGNGRFFLFSEGLHLVEYFLADDSGMTVFYIELIYFAPVFHADVWKSGCKGFLAEGIARIFFVSQPAGDSIRYPCCLSMFLGNTSAVHFFRDCDDALQ
ncbi:hypothetical protein AALA54_12980 [Oscillospiraceae bacterium 44-34]